MLLVIRHYATSHKLVSEIYGNVLLELINKYLSIIVSGIKEFCVVNNYDLISSLMGYRQHFSNLPKLSDMPPIDAIILSYSDATDI